MVVLREFDYLVDLGFKAQKMGLRHALKDDQIKRE